MFVSFKIFILESEEKPNVKLSSYNKDSFQHVYYDKKSIFHVEHPLLKKPLRIHIYHKHYQNPNLAKIDITDKNYSIKHLGHLGTKNMMHVLGRIKHHFPYIHEIEGTRITGSRKNKPENIQHTSISIKHVKPIPPSENE